jgi:hypothetical protein
MRRMSRVHAGEHRLWKSCVERSSPRYTIPSAQTTMTSPTYSASSISRPKRAPARRPRRDPHPLGRPPPRVGALAYVPATLLLTPGQPWSRTPHRRPRPRGACGGGATRRSWCRAPCRRKRRRGRQDGGVRWFVLLFLCALLGQGHDWKNKFIDSCVSVLGCQMSKS